LLAEVFFQIFCIVIAIIGSFHAATLISDLLVVVVTHIQRASADLLRSFGRLRHKLRRLYAVDRRFPRNMLKPPAGAKRKRDRRSPA
jgi:hypothetical protein